MRRKSLQVLPEARRILALAWPVLLSSVNWTLMQMIDVAIVGYVGGRELGALAAGRAISFIVVVVGVAALSGIIVFSSRAHGAKDYPRCGAVLRQGMLCCLLIGLPIAAVMAIWAYEITRGIGIAPEFVAEGSTVVRVMAVAFPAQMILTGFAFFLEGVSRPGRSMVVNLTMLPANALLAWAWTTGHLGLPGLGAVGAASATAVVAVVGALGMGVAVWTLPEAEAMGIRTLKRAAWKQDLLSAPKLAGFGIIPGIASGFEMLGFSYLITLSTQLGAISTDAFQAVFALHNVAFAAAIGLASAAGVRAGNAVGEGVPREALPRTMVAVGLLAIATGALSMLYIVAGHSLMGLFSTQPRVIELATAMLRMLAPFILFDGLQLVCVYALRSLGDQIAAGINGIIAFFFGTGGLAWWLIARNHGGPFDLIFAAATGMVLAAILQGGRLYWVNRRMGLQSSG